MLGSALEIRQRLEGRPGRPALLGKSGVTPTPWEELAVREVGQPTEYRAGWLAILLDRHLRRKLGPETRENGHNRGNGRSPSADARCARIPELT